MIANPEATLLLSSMGWIDHDALWRFETAGDRLETIPLNSGARYVSLHTAGRENFAVAHHFDGHRFEVSVRGFADPGRVLAAAVVEDGRRELLGDASKWADVPRLYIEYLSFVPWKDYALVKVLPAAAAVEIQRLEWYDSSYDKDYQAVIDVVELPGDCAVISVQRSSRLVLHDLQTGAQERTIDLGSRAGNPKLGLRDSGRELWATDYDTLVVVRIADWKIRKRSRLQSAFTGTQQFIGDYSFAPDGKFCAVARPFSGDIVGVNIETFKVRLFAKTGMQPLEVAALREGRVVARDWKTGGLLQGTLQPRWFGL